MTVIVKPFSTEYLERCADLLQYLWKTENREQRINHFKWGYPLNPNNEGFIAAVIAVNEEDEVVGFRGFHLLKAYFGNNLERIAYIADTVVSPNARRQGIFQKMTEYSFKYLVENGIYCIGDLGPSWPPYHGNKKLAFEDLSDFHRKFRFSLTSLIIQKVFKKKREWNRIDEQYKKGTRQFFISTDVPDEVLHQVPNEKAEGVIYPCRDFANLRWKASHPGAKYIYCWSVDSQKRVDSFIWFKTKDGYGYTLGLYFSNNVHNLKQLFGFFDKVVRPSKTIVWTWALSDNARQCIKKLHFVGIPFLDSIKKNPPSLVRSLITNSDETINWSIEGIDIRNSYNWVVDKFEADSF